jgi:hypothetical protein
MEGGEGRGLEEGDKCEVGGRGRSSRRGALAREVASGEEEDPLSECRRSCPALAPATGAASGGAEETEGGEGRE